MKVYDKHYYCGSATVKLNFKEHLILALTGRVFVFKARKPGWTADLPFNIVRCKRHGFFFAYPQGFSGRSDCPKCLDELLKRRGVEVVQPSP